MTRQQKNTPADRPDRSEGAPTNSIIARSGIVQLENRTIYLDDSQVMADQTPAARRRRKYKVLCNICGSVSWLEYANAIQDRVCFHCAQSTRGRKGWQAAWADPARRHDMVERLAVYYRQNMSAPELTVEAWLRGWCYPFEAQVPFIPDQDANGFYIADFVVALGYNRRAIIEVNGYWHKRVKARRDSRLEGFALAGGYGLVWVDAIAIETGIAARRLLLALAELKHGAGEIVEIG